jgi:hypothetical protein
VGSHWDLPDDWMIALSKGARELSATWWAKDSKLPETIEMIQVTAQAAGTRRGFVELTYQFDNWEAIFTEDLK